jgi:hypothetical protein
MRPCPVCTHKNVQEIDRRLLAGESAAQVAADNAVRHRAMLHHETEHLSAKLQRGAQATRIAEAKDLFEELARRYERFGAMELKLERMLDQITTVCRQFEGTKDVVRFIAVLREQRDTIRELRETGRAALEVLKLLAIARGIAEPPEGYRATPIDVAQAARDLFGITEDEMPTLPTEAQRALPAAEDIVEEAPEPAPQPTPRPEPQTDPVESGAARYERTQREIEKRTTPDGNWQISRDPDLAERVKRAKPVQDAAYQQQLNRAHAEGRRLEVGEASPNMLGTDVDFSRPKPPALPPVPSSVYLGGDGGRCRCPEPGCQWEGLLSNLKAYETHYRTTHTQLD